MTPRLLTTMLAALALSATAVAAEQPSTTLNSLEVKRLVAAGGPADHARLRDHFAALAAEYGRDADEDVAAARGVVGNPNRRLTPAPGAAFARRADVTRARATILSELAAHHGRLAAGQPSTLPAGSAAYESGEGARVPTDSELRQLAAAARTPADHFALEEYYLGVAADQRGLVDRHVTMAAGRRGNAGGRTLSGDSGVHCDRLVKQARKAGKAAIGEAMVHRQLATVAG